MSAVKHTPGPWRIVPHRTSIEIQGGSDTYVAAVYGTEDDEPRANAKLIASAPALADELAALVTAASEMRCRCSLEEINSGHHVDCGKPALLERVDHAIAVLALAGRLP